MRSSGSTGGYIDLINKWGSAWETPNAPSYPLDVNIIGADGDSVRDPRLLPAQALAVAHCFRRTSVCAASERYRNVEEDLRRCQQGEVAEGRISVATLSWTMCRWTVGLTPGVAVQTTAYQALSGPGQLGKIPTGVQFRITNPSDTAVRLVSPPDHVGTACMTACCATLLWARFGTAGHAGISASGWADARAAHRPSLTSPAVRAQLVQSVNGGPAPTGVSPGGSTPSGSPSATPSPTSGGGGSSGSSGCTDRAPSQYYTCQQQARARLPPLHVVTLWRRRQLYK